MKGHNQRQQCCVSLCDTPCVLGGRLAAGWERLCFKHRRRQTTRTHVPMFLPCIIPRRMTRPTRAGAQTLARRARSAHLPTTGGCARVAACLREACRCRMWKQRSACLGTARCPAAAFTPARLAAAQGLAPPRAHTRTHTTHYNARSRPPSPALPNRGLPCIHTPPLSACSCCGSSPYALHGHHQQHQTNQQRHLARRQSMHGGLQQQQQQAHCRPLFGPDGQQLSPLTEHQQHQLGAWEADPDLGQQESWGSEGGGDAHCMQGWQHGGSGGGGLSSRAVTSVGGCSDSSNGGARRCDLALANTSQCPICSHHTRECIWWPQTCPRMHCAAVRAALRSAGELPAERHGDRGAAGPARVRHVTGGVGWKRHPTQHCNLPACMWVCVRTSVAAQAAVQAGVCSSTTP